MTRVKICGVTDPDDARAAVELGAWAIGLVLWDGSPRRCSPEAAEEIGALYRRQAQIAGVFVNETLEVVAAAAERYHLGLLQLHGDEGPAYCREAARRTGARVVKAVRVADASSVRGLGAFHVDLHLLDTLRRDLRGGTGETFDWQLAVRRRATVPLILSGGLHADNVGEAIETVRPYAVDTASGTELRPGIKDLGRVQAFFRAVEAADRRLEPPEALPPDDATLGPAPGDGVASGPPHAPSDETPLDGEAASGPAPLEAPGETAATGGRP